MASLLYRFPVQSETMGRTRGACERRQVVQKWDWTSRWASLTCAVLGDLAASRTSSRRVGMLFLLVLLC